MMPAAPAGTSTSPSTACCTASCESGTVSTTSLPATCSAGNNAASPITPPNTTGVSLKVIVLPLLKPHSLPSSSDAPPAMNDDIGSTFLLLSGSVWKNVPLSPAGCRPRRLASRASNSVALKLPSVPASRPMSESSAKMYSRVIRSSAVIALLVGRGASLSGNAVRGTGAVAIGCDLGASCALTTDDRAPEEIVPAMRRRPIDTALGSIRNPSELIGHSQKEEDAPRAPAVRVSWSSRLPTGYRAAPRDAGSRFAVRPTSGPGCGFHRRLRR